MAHHYFGERPRAYVPCPNALCRNKIEIIQQVMQTGRTGPQRDVIVFRQKVGEGVMVDITVDWTHVVGKWIAMGYHRHDKDDTPPRWECIGFSKLVNFNCRACNKSEFGYYLEVCEDLAQRKEKVKGGLTFFLQRLRR